MKAIKLSGDNDIVLSIELKDVLDCIPQGDKFNWGILWIDVVGNINDTRLIPTNNYEINNTDTVTMVTWNELVKLSFEIHQSIELLLIGDRDISNIQRYPDEEQMYNNCTYTIELIDSSYWIIHSDDIQFVNSLFERLKGVEYIDF